VTATISIAQRASEMRTAFDRSFAEAPQPPATLRHDFLTVTIGTDRYAIRLSEVAGLFADRRITPVPGRAPSLVGIAGFRGAVIPVFDLRTILGYSSAQRPRWLVIAAAMPVALAFDSFDGHLRLAPEAVVPQSAGDTLRGCVRDTARAHDISRPIVDIAAVLQAIKPQSRLLEKPAP
jgi:chemotaxis signal transduction protein